MRVCRVYGVYRFFRAYVVLGFIGFAGFIENRVYRVEGVSQLMNAGGQFFAFGNPLLW